MVIITRKPRYISGSYYLLLDSSLVKEFKIDKNTIVQAEIKLVKRMGVVDGPNETDDITIDDINKSNIKQGDERNVRRSEN